MKEPSAQRGEGRSRAQAPALATLLPSPIVLLLPQALVEHFFLCICLRGASLAWLLTSYLMTTERTLPHC